MLLLDGIVLIELTEDDKAYLEGFKNAKTLSMSYCALKTLKNLPILPSLEILDLSDNLLSGEDLSSVY